VTELWLWGGVGVAYKGDVDGTALNDTWSFDTGTLEWTRHRLAPGQTRSRRSACYWRARLTRMQDRHMYDCVAIVTDRRSYFAFKQVPLRQKEEIGRTFGRPTEVTQSG
jgi:hypothetical protein